MEGRRRCAGVLRECLQGIGAIRSIATSCLDAPVALPRERSRRYTTEHQCSPCCGGGDDDDGHRRLPKRERLAAHNGGGVMVTRALCLAVVHTCNHCLTTPVPFFLDRGRPRVRRDYPPNLSISISGGKETNRDSLSKGD